MFDLMVVNKGALKIAYELAFYWFGDSYLSDPQAAVFREILRGEAAFDDASIQGQIELGCRDGVWTPWAAWKDAHIAFSVAKDDRLLIFIRIFDVLSAHIIVSHQASCYVPPTPRDMPMAHDRFLYIDSVTKETRHSSMMEEVLRLCGEANKFSADS